MTVTTISEFGSGDPVALEGKYKGLWQRNCLPIELMLSIGISACHGDNTNEPSGVLRQRRVLVFRLE